MMTNEKIKEAKSLFYQKQYKKALDIFVKHDECFYESGLCALLLKDENTAFNFWNKNSNKCPACAFGLCVLECINLKQERIPTFFQTRAQLEIYINLFLENNYIDWAENLIGYCDMFYRSNPESYKFIARALFANGYFDMAIFFANKTLRLFYCDPEAFLILAQCEFLLGNLAQALDTVNRVNSMVSDYFPAKVFKMVILDEMNKKNNKK